MASGKETLRCRLRISLRTLLLLFIPAALATSLAIWLFIPPTINVVTTVDRFLWFRTLDGRGLPVLALGAEVRVVNRSRCKVWYLENARYYLFECVDAEWTGSWSGTLLPETPERELWSALEGMQSMRILVPISKDATEIKVGIPFTADRFNRKAHWVFTPMMKIKKEGEGYSPEVVPRNSDEVRIESAFAR